MPLPTPVGSAYKAVSFPRCDMLISRWRAKTWVLCRRLKYVQGPCEFDLGRRCVRSAYTKPRPCTSECGVLAYDSPPRLLRLQNAHRGSCRAGGRSRRATVRRGSNLRFFVLHCQLMLLTDLQLAAGWSPPAYRGLGERRSSDDSGQVAYFRMILRARRECRQENKDRKPFAVSVEQKWSDTGTGGSCFLGD